MMRDHLMTKECLLRAIKESGHRGNHVTPHAIDTIFESGSFYTIGPAHKGIGTLGIGQPIVTGIKGSASGIVVTNIGLRVGDFRRIFLHQFRAIRVCLKGE